MKTLWSMLGRDAHLQASCSHYSCRHRTVMRVAPVLKLFQARGWNADLSIAGSWFRCKRCGRRGAHLEMVPACVAPHLDRP